MNALLSGAVRGAAAGAAGTTTLNAVTYLDMAVRGRPSSSTPQQTVQRITEETGIDVPGGEKERSNRLAGLGPMMGLVAGVGVGAVLGMLRSAGFRPPLPVSAAVGFAGAMAGGNGPMAVFGVTDPRSWSAKEWAADIVPHAAYGVVTAMVLDGLDGRR